ncbi:N-acetylneuraminate synthase [Enterococcus faecium]|uniref:N-acetylneuraminate synthase n=1 Tax=Enterococcus faecium TaxID=1352 RepID=UPI0010C13C25|nr:N-acetylneuraminate synthase [Enterococcus faecium]MBW4152368.1 N-acetylneuraminate synthase [Enterococcus faecium]TKN51323.1 N-acetylneuraminate synthase [Enterococcus faecium]TKN99178.1 N-acetylneuraminate synthase [Enterococcus faecium]TKQ41705.1 N-acetylneuraminate synthase [Enterococcus faecium]TKQ55483.1 N-acetylneuraminate synthase [Enterococcus faecium]
METQSSVYVIAEIGVNHNGNLDLALKSIDAAKECGANAVKFQTFKTSRLTSKKAKMANYQKQNLEKVESQYDMLKKLELTEEDFFTIKEYCEEIEIDFLSTPFDDQSASFLKELGVEGIKIGSGDLTNIPFLREIDMYGLPVLLSTGMSNIEEVREAIECFQYSPVTLLHCTSNYPAMSEDINLNALNTLRNEFSLPMGYSDHSLGYEVAICAIAMGAEVIEKHFTLSQDLPGPDHKASLNPEEFKAFVEKIRDAELFLGDGIKRAMPSELSTKDVARKSIVFTSNLEAGMKISKDDITIKRPGTGLAPKYLYEVIGKKIKSDVMTDDVLTEDLLE